MVLQNKMSYHVKDIFINGELDEKSSVKKILHQKTQSI